MASLGQVYNVNELPEETDFSPLVPNNYDVMIVSGDFVETSKKDGKYLKLELQVIGGEYDGRKLYDNMNLVNPNEKAEEIAFKRLGSYCKAVGLSAIKDSDELLNKRVTVKVEVEKSKDYFDTNGNKKEGKNQNKIASVLPFGSKVDQATSASSSEVANSQNPDSPWKRKR